MIDDNILFKQIYTKNIELTYERFSSVITRPRPHYSASHNVS